MEYLETPWDKRISGIYKLQFENKVYIGQSRNKKRRFISYRALRCSEQPRLCNCMKKYGVENFSFEMLIDLNPELPQSEFDRMEQEFMDLFREIGYEMLNLRDAGSKGKLSHDSKTKLSISGKSRWTKEERLQLSKEMAGSNNHFYGKKHDDFTKMKMV